MERLASVFGTGGARAGMPDHEQLSQWLFNVGVAMAIAAIGWWLSKLLARAVDRLLLRFGVEEILRGFLRGLVYATGLVVVAVAALDAIGVPTTSLLAVLGAAGLAIGLALKDSLANIASGVMLIVLRPFRAGDTVLIAGAEGVVVQVRIFQTVLRTAQNHDVILPNSQITTSPIVNYTSRPQRRVDIPLNLGYGEDIGRVRTLLLDTVRANPRVLAEPVADVAVQALGEHAVALVLRAWVNTADYTDARSELFEAVRDLFVREDIALQIPRREILAFPVSAPASD